MCGAFLSPTFEVKTSLATFPADGVTPNAMSLSGMGHLHIHSPTVGDPMLNSFILLPWQLLYPRLRVKSKLPSLKLLFLLRRLQKGQTTLALS